MKIVNVEIEGFGIYHKASLQNLPEGLVLILGDNEAGKSTFLGFIRSLLFGFPDGRSSENLYEPLAGGQHGGRLVVQTERKGTVVIERRQGTKGGPVTLHDEEGTSGGEEELKHLLGGMTKPIYKNIYAFSLEELQTFASLDEEGVKGALYGAGAGTALMAIPQTMKKLKAHLENLFKPGGRNPQINVMLSSLEEVQEKIKNAANEIKEYEEAFSSQKEIIAKIARFQQDELDLRSKSKRMDTYLQLWEEWVLMQDLEDQLEHLPVIVTQYPDEGLNRLNDLQKTLESEKNSLNKRLQEQSDYEIQGNNLRPEDTLIAQESSLYELITRREIYAKNLKEVPLNQLELERKKSDIQRELDNLGSDWTEKRIYAVDRSLFTQDAMRRYQSKLQETKKERESAEETLRVVKEEQLRSQQEEEVATKEIEKYQDLEFQVSEEMLLSIQRGRDQFASVVKDIPKRKKEWEDAKNALKHAIQEIDPDWSLSEVQTFDGSVPAQEKIQRFEHELNAASAQLTETKNKLELEETNLFTLQKELKRVEDDYQAIPEPSWNTRDAFVVRKNDIKLYKNCWNQKNLLLETLTHQKERLSDKQALLLETSALARQPFAKYLKRLSFILLLSALVAGGLLAAMGRLLEGSVLGGLLLVLGVALNRLVESQFSSRKSQPAEEKKKQEIQKIEAQLKNLEQQQLRLESQVQELRNKLGLAERADSKDVDFLESQMDEALKAFDDRVRLKEELDRIKSKETSVKENVEKLRNRLTSQQNARSQALDEWKEHLGRLLLKPGTMPRTVELIFAKVDSIKTRIVEVQTLEKRIEEMESSSQEYGHLLRKVPELSAKVTVDPTELLSWVDGFLRQSKNMVDRKQKRDLAARTLEEKQKNRRSLDEKLENAKKRLTLAMDQETRNLEEWRLWLDKTGLDQNISPETALKALDTINNCIRFIDAKAELEKSLRQKEKEIFEFNSLSEKVFSKIDRTVPQHESLISAIELLHQEVNQNKALCEKKKNLQGPLDKVKREIKAIEHEIETIKSKMDALLQEANAENEAHFRTLGQSFEERSEILSRMKITLGTLKKISGQHNFDTLKENLKPYTRDALENESQRLQQQLQGLVPELEDLRQKKADLNQKIINLASSEEISRLRAEEEKIKEEIRVLSKEWGTHALAKFLLDEARKRFEKEHQPKVIQEASHYFKTFTGQQYQNIIAPLGERTVEVIARDGSRKKPQHLSRATAEQLYLAIRFGYMTSYAEKSEVLPVIMDDILVNFDPGRSHQTSRAIIELAKNHQVWFFTCHPETISIFQAQDPRVAVYQIKAGSFKAATGS
ncbi:AAA family ATPase [Deltaproteobacteria bacterium TL4]